MGTGIGFQLFTSVVFLIPIEDVIEPPSISVFMDSSKTTSSKEAVNLTVYVSLPTFTVAFPSSSPLLFIEKLVLSDSKETLTFPSVFPVTPKESSPSPDAE